LLSKKSLLSGENEREKKLFNRNFAMGVIGQIISALGNGVLYILLLF